MQSIFCCPDFQGDSDWLSFWTLKDFQPTFAPTQGKTDYSRKPNYLCWTRVRQCTVCINLS